MARDVTCPTHPLVIVLMKYAKARQISQHEDAPRHLANEMPLNTKEKDDVTARAPAAGQALQELDLIPPTQILHRTREELVPQHKWTGDDGGNVDGRFLRQGEAPRLPEPPGCGRDPRRERPFRPEPPAEAREE